MDEIDLNLERNGDELPVTVYYWSSIENRQPDERYLDIDIERVEDPTGCEVEIDEGERLYLESVIERELAEKIRR